MEQPNKTRIICRIDLNKLPNEVLIYCGRAIVVFRVEISRSAIFGPENYQTPVVLVDIDLNENEVAVFEIPLDTNIV